MRPRYKLVEAMTPHILSTISFGASRLVENKQIEALTPHKILSLMAQAALLGKKEIYPFYKIEWIYWFSKMENQRLSHAFFSRFYIPFLDHTSYMALRTNKV